MQTDTLTSTASAHAPGATRFSAAPRAEEAAAPAAKNRRGWRLSGHHRPAGDREERGGEGAAQRRARRRKFEQKMIT